MLSGRIRSFRNAGTKLIFINLFQEGHSVQGVCNFGIIKPPGDHLENLRDFVHSLHRGDVYSKILQLLRLGLTFLILR